MHRRPSQLALWLAFAAASTLGENPTDDANLGNLADSIQDLFGDVGPDALGQVGASPRAVSNGAAAKAAYQNPAPPSQRRSFVAAGVGASRKHGLNTSSLASKKPLAVLQAPTTSNISTLPSQSGKASPPASAVQRRLPMGNLSSNPAAFAVEGRHNASAANATAASVPLVNATMSSSKVEAAPITANATVDTEAPRAAVTKTDLGNQSKQQSEIPEKDVEELPMATLALGNDDASANSSSATTTPAPQVVVKPQVRHVANASKAAVVAAASAARAQVEQKQQQKQVEQKQAEQQKQVEQKQQQTAKKTQRHLPQEKQGDEAADRKETPLRQPPLQPHSPRRQKALLIRGPPTPPTSAVLPSDIVTPELPLERSSPPGEKLAATAETVETGDDKQMDATPMEAAPPIDVAPAATAAPAAQDSISEPPVSGVGWLFSFFSRALFGSKSASPAPVKQDAKPRPAQALLARREDPIQRTARSTKADGLHIVSLQDTWHQLEDEDVAAERRLRSEDAAARSYAAEREEPRQPTRAEIEERRATHMSGFFAKLEEQDKGLQASLSDVIGDSPRASSARYQELSTLQEAQVARAEAQLHGAPAMLLQRRRAERRIANLSL